MQQSLGKVYVTAEEITKACIEFAKIISDIHGDNLADDNETVWSIDTAAKLFTAQLVSTCMPCELERRLPR
jgi:hypothetical protein